MVIITLTHRKKKWNELVTVRHCVAGLLTSTDTGPALVNNKPK